MKIIAHKRYKSILSFKVGDKIQFKEDAFTDYRGPSYNNKIVTLTKISFFPRYVCIEEYFGSWSIFKFKVEEDEN